ncbi:YdiK family protein [Ornithinibacillus salinisoli]|uniref:YdiK family protein n=1 Tax=Ornithinibacillus salinisoli TaxID=1848459 RepID=A0ABW4W3Y2_9BACI
MRFSPKTMAFIYFAMGFLFMYIALQSANGRSIWNFTTVLFAAFATLDFGVGIRLIRIHVRIKRDKKKE